MVRLTHIKCSVPLSGWEQPWCIGHISKSHSRDLSHQLHPYQLLTREERFPTELQDKLFSLQQILREVELTCLLPKQGNP